jgi:cytoskeletal protein RodZ
VRPYLPETALIKTAETAASSPGAILKRCREYHEITLEEASETTKIGISHLSALEEDQICEFANRAYLKGFLRIYSAYLGLNSDDLSRMYDKLYGIATEAGDTSVTPVEKKHTRPDRRLILLKKLAFPGMLLLLVLIAATFFRGSPPPARPVPVAAVTALPRAALLQPLSSARNTTAAPPIKPAPTVSSPEVKSEPEAENDTHSPDTLKGFVLKIKVIQNGTMAATVDGAGVQNYELSTGDIIEWKAERGVALELSNAGGVEIELNGKPHKQLGPQGKPVYVEFNANGLKP